MTSAILKAVAEKLIPGIPKPTRISILQQTSTEEAPPSTGGETSQVKSTAASDSQLSVLAEVIDRATSQIEIQREIDSQFSSIITTGSCQLTNVTLVLSKAVNEPENVFAPLRAFRKIMHERLKKELFEHDKDARLRSGTRGMAARKALIAFEKAVAESSER